MKRVVVEGSIESNKKIKVDPYIRKLSLLLDFSIEQVEDLEKLLKMKDACVSGSMAVWLMCENEKEWIPNDIDLFVSQKQSNDILKWFLNVGYDYLKEDWKYVRNKVQGCDYDFLDYLDNGKVESKLYNVIKGNQRIQIIEIEKPSKKEWSTFLFHRFDLQECSVVWPMNNTNQELLLNIKNRVMHLNKSCDPFTPRKQSRIKKYEQRGFAIFHPMLKESKSKPKQMYYKQIDKLPEIHETKLKSVETWLIQRKEFSDLLDKYTDKTKGDALQKGYYIEWIDLGEEVFTLYNNFSEQEKQMLSYLQNHKLDKTKHKVRNLWEWIQIWICTSSFERGKLFHFGLDCDVGPGAALYGHAKSMDLFHCFQSGLHEKYQSLSRAELVEKRNEKYEKCIIS